MRIQERLREMGQDTHSAQCTEAADYIDRLEAVIEATRAYFDALDDFQRRYPEALGGPGQGDVRRALECMIDTCSHGSTMMSCKTCEDDRARALRLFPSLRRHLGAPLNGGQGQKT